MPTSNQPIDRILDALLLRAEQDATQRTLNPALRSGDPYLVQLRLDHYQSIFAAYTRLRDLTRQERQGLSYVRSQIRRLDAYLRPSLGRRIRYWPPIDRLINWTRGRAAIIAGYDRRIQDEENRTTQQQNVQRLSEEMKKAGFTVSLEGPLKRAIAHNLSSFSLPYAAAGDSRTDYTLFFRKLPGTDVYYFEKFDAAAKPTVAEVLRSKTQLIRHEFSLVDESVFTARQAASLVHGIPVPKAIGDREYWTTIDAQGNRNQVLFNLEKELASFSILEMQDPTRKNALLSALRSGTTREVTFADSSDRGQKVVIQVDSNAQGLLFKDKDGHLLTGLLQAGTHLEKMMAKKNAQTLAPVRSIYPRHHA